MDAKARVPRFAVILIGVHTVVFLFATMFFFLSLLFFCRVFVSHNLIKMFLSI